MLVQIVTQVAGQAPDRGSMKLMPGIDSMSNSAVATALTGVDRYLHESEK